MVSALWITIFCTSTVQSLTAFTQCVVIVFFQEEKKIPFESNHSSIMHWFKILSNMSLTAMEKTLHVITKDKWDDSPFHLITMLHLLCLRLYIPLICICFACWVGLRQSASHLPKDFWCSLPSLISWSTEKELKYFDDIYSMIHLVLNEMSVGWSGTLYLSGDFLFLLCIYTVSLGWWNE